MILSLFVRSYNVQELKYHMDFAFDVIDSTIMNGSLWQNDL